VLVFLAFRLASGITKQGCDEFDIVPNLPGDDGAGALPLRAISPAKALTGQPVPG
jgi:hypothetical protein